MIERRYFQPKAGRKYLNRNGSTYFCLAKGKKPYWLTVVTRTTTAQWNGTILQSTAIMTSNHSLKATDSTVI